VPFHLVATVFLVLFVVSVARDRRQLRNGVYLGLTLVFFAVGWYWTLSHRTPLVPAVAASVVFVLTPLLGLLLAVFLITNGVTMIKREGARPANLLSLLVGLGIVGFAVLAFAGVLTRSTPLLVVTVSIALLIGYASFVFTCYLLYSFLYGRMPRRDAVDFVVVLGAGLVGARVPPLLANRLDLARKVFDASTAAGRTPMIVTSGGQGPDEEVSEARAMADHLIERGVPDDRILLEERSTTTLENLRFSRAIMERVRPDARCVVVTNNFHAFRAALWARKARVNGHVVGAPTARYFLPNAIIREFVAVLVEHLAVNVSIGAVLALIFPLAIVVMS
jgi:uncharacterized SAM-binding protein YcdF (DUF218 family)